MAEPGDIVQPGLLSNMSIVKIVWRVLLAELAVLLGLRAVFQAVVGMDFVSFVFQAR